MTSWMASSRASPSRLLKAILAWVSMAGTISRKASCQAGVDFRQRTDFADVVMGTISKKWGLPQAGVAILGSNATRATRTGADQSDNRSAQRLELNVEFHTGRKHLPIVTLRRAA